MSARTQAVSASERKRVVVVTGMSGAGKSTALKALEDLGYEAVDNLPLSLLPNLLTLSAPEQSQMAAPQALAIGLDFRTRAFNPEQLIALLRSMADRPDAEVSLLMLDCSDETLVRRFTETRRRHPLAADRPVLDGIAQERHLMESLRDRADFVIDTGDLSIHDLRRVLAGQFGLSKDGRLTISVTSFSYARGLPREADIVFDVRFLKNPHYEDELRPLTGKDSGVGAFIEQDPAFRPFMDKMSDLLLTLLPRFQGEGKSYLTISFGCTGGRHRSVFLAEKLAAVLEKKGYHPGVVHRDAGID